MLVRFFHAMRTSNIRTILLIANLSLLGIILCFIGFFRIYETTLVADTERELIAQAVSIAAAYKHEIASHLEDSQPYGKKLSLSDKEETTEYYTPLLPQLNQLYDTIYPIPMEPVATSTPIDPIAKQAYPMMQHMFTHIEKFMLSGIAIMDYNGVLLGEEPTSIAHQEEVGAALEGEYMSVLRKREHNAIATALSSISRNTSKRVHVAFPIIEEGYLWGVVYVYRSPQTFLQHLYTHRSEVIVIGFVILTVIIIISLLLSFSLSQPLRYLAQEIQAVHKGKKAYVTPIDSPVAHEIAIVSESLASLSSALYKQAKSTQALMTAAFHALKRPHSTIKIAIDTLQHKDGRIDEKKRQELMAGIREDLDYMDDQLRDLLVLANIEAKDKTTETIDMVEALHTIVSHYQDHEVNITLHAPKVTCPLAIELHTMEVICSNLINNSTDHSANIVDISMTCDEQHITLIFADNGTGIKPSYHHQLFVPFFTTRREKGGTGMGLRIVQSLVKLHGGTIEHMPSTDRTLFKIVFTSLK